MHASVRADRKSSAPIPSRQPTPCFPAPCWTCRFANLSSVPRHPKQRIGDDVPAKPVPQETIDRAAKLYIKYKSTNRVAKEMGGISGVTVGRYLKRAGI